MLERLLLGESRCFCPRWRLRQVRGSAMGIAASLFQCRLICWEPALPWTSISWCPHRSSIHNDSRRVCHLIDRCHLLEPKCRQLPLVKTESLSLQAPQRGSAWRGTSSQWCWLSLSLSRQWMGSTLSSRYLGSQQANRFLPTFPTLLPSIHLTIFASLLELIRSLTDSCHLSESFVL